MSLSKNLIVISNTYEGIKIANLIEDGIKDVADIIKYALNEEELESLIKILKRR